MSEHLGKDELDPHEDVLPETDPNAEDVFDADMRRPHIPLRGAGAVPFEDRSEVDDLEDQKRVLWQARVRAGVQSIGRMVKELGSFLASFDEWERARILARRTPIIRAPRTAIETALPLKISEISLGGDPRYSELPPEGMINIPGGSSFIMKNRPQCLFKGRRLAILPEDATELLVLDVKIGKNSQLAASGEISAKHFAVEGGLPFVTETARVSMDVSVTFLHTGAAARKPPRVTFFGDVVE